MTRTEIENSVEFIRLQKAIKATMISIAYHAFMRKSYDKDFNEDKRYHKICEDVNTAFSAIANCFEDFQCITDTMCRDFAKSEIINTISQLDKLTEENPNFDEIEYLEKTITAEEVLEDILDMNSEEETDEVS